MCCILISINITLCLPINLLQGAASGVMNRTMIIHRKREWRDCSPLGEMAHMILLIFIELQDFSLYFTISINLHKMYKES